MLRKNQKEEMPFAYYLAKYAGLDPAEVTARLGGDVTFDGEAFGLSFLGRPYRLAWPDYAIESPDAAALALRKMPAQTFLLRYLERGQQIPFGGAWLNFRQLPWGRSMLRRSAAGAWAGRPGCSAMRCRPFPTPAAPWAARPSRGRTPALSCRSSARTGYASCSGPGTMNFPPARRSCIPTNSPAALPRRTASSRRSCCLIASAGSCRENKSRETTCRCGRSRIFKKGVYHDGNLQI